MAQYCNFEQSSVWQLAHKVVLRIYPLTKSFPKDETFALTSQIRISAISIEANIAEAFGRYHHLDKLNFYYNSRGSVEETKSHLITSRDLQYISLKEYAEIRNMLEILGKELNPVIISLRSKKK